MATASLDWLEYANPEFTGGAITIGNFDGVHRGHQALIARAKELAASVRGPVVVVTFDPPPHQVLYAGTERQPLTTVAERAELLHAVGADHVIVLRTSRELLALSPEAFFEDMIARQIGAKAIVEGYDFRFGRGRVGTNATLRELCANAQMEFAEVEAFTLNGEAVSSSRVRSAIVSGDVSRATELLNREYAIRGTVVTGAQRGRTIGFPTANLGDVQTVLPGNGVYAVRAILDGKEWPAAANIGPNPTFGEDARKIEVHLIGFAGDIYGATLRVQFVSRLRETKPFRNVDELVQQLRHDIAHATSVLGSA
jgi:riboflavin kinase/FMN adenylyltransferase